jgi:hypothetical protein
MIPRPPRKWEKGMEENEAERREGKKEKEGHN